MHTVMYIRVPHNAENFKTCWANTSFRRPVNMGSTKLHMSQTNGKGLRVMHCPLTAMSINHPQVPNSPPSVDLLRRTRHPDQHTYGGGWALRHNGWRRTSAVSAEQRRHVLDAAYFIGSVTSARAIRRVQSGDITVDRVPNAATATSYGVDGPGIESREGRIARTRSDRPWGPPSLLRSISSFPGVRWLGCGVNQPPHLPPRLKEE
jgi:hypothetical protein